MDVSLKDQPDLDPNDQTAVLEYLGKVVSVGILSAIVSRLLCQTGIQVSLLRIECSFTIQSSWMSKCYCLELHSSRALIVVLNAPCTF
jgi:hypothetical protein